MNGEEPAENWRRFRKLLKEKTLNEEILRQEPIRVNEKVN